MVKITYVEHDGERTTVDAQPGESMMKAAVSHGVAGIEAVCGGNCACGTCRIYVDDNWRAKLPSPGESESEMIDFCGDPDPRVRLSCQIAVSEDLDGMEVTLPESQQ
ncbi:2Fe-2S iron-sulfur cluster-binding protein [Novosphingobium malaysiense]|uniref:2Fe-2S ferredoxin n=1 Tax=Novosphingobium malaysiense TaxID=1348853 RepID=A0A0B1ZPY0_9SPHN|nr:2Fe-2S iron-sulfur cluster-binding protein [Novosphingobium malaysiense]KHK93175.1 2Fe-2S ferredoxin [Novosphingobium malaysiense]